MLRGVIAGGLCIAIQVGALCAPLVHAHLEDHHDGHHDAVRVHAHFSGHAVEHHDAMAATTAIHSAPDAEQVTRLQLFVAVQAAGFTAPALPQARFTLPPAEEAGERRAPDVVRSHGPPAGLPDTSRAPPDLSVLI